MRVLASWGVCLVVSLLAHSFGFGSLGIGLLATAQAQSVPKSLEEGGTDNAMRSKKNSWTVDVAGTQADVFEYFRTQRKISNLEYRVNYIVRLPVSEVHVLARTEIQKLEDLKGKTVRFGP